MLAINNIIVCLLIGGLPFVGGFVGFVRSYRSVFNISLFCSSLALLLISLLVCQYDAAQGLIQFNSIVDTWVFVDGLGLSLLWLTGVIFPVAMLYSWSSYVFSSRLYFQLLLVIEYCIVVSLLSNHILGFYLLYEALAIPMFFLIGLAGSRGRKLHAAYLFLFFALGSSILLLTAIAIIYQTNYTLFFDELKFISVGRHWQIIIAVLVFLGFATKIPVVPFHIWLPEAHVEAPTVGSVILAAIFLKFGFYGMYRLILPICCSDVLFQLRPLFFSICSVSIVYASLAAIRQVDLKKIIAYSSIVHMNFALLGIFVVSNIGVIGSMFLMISHGIISAGMFMGIGILYDRFHVRNIMYFGGLVQFMPLFTIYFVIVMLSNMSLPGTCNFVGELLVFFSLIGETENWLVLLACLSSILLVAIFSLLVVARVCFYQLTGFFDSQLRDLQLNELLCCFVIVFYVLLFGVVPNLLINLFV